MTIGSMIEIHDPADPRIGLFLNQKDAWLRAAHNPERVGGAQDADQGYFMAEGVLVVEQLIESRFPVESVLVTRNRARAVDGVLSRLGESTPIYVVDQGVMDEIVGFPMHRGLLACGRRLPNPDPLKLAKDSRALIVLEDLSNHDNVGSVFRSAAALGGRGVGVILSERCCDPLYRKALRVSMGHVLRVPWALTPDVPKLLGELVGLGYETLALTPDKNAENIDEVASPAIDRPVLCFGAEGPGLSKAALSVVGRRVRIPMASGVDSLNIAVAAAVSMHRCLAPR